MQKKYIIHQDNLNTDLLGYYSYSDSQLTYAKKSDDVLNEVRDYVSKNERIDTNEIMKRMFPIDDPHIFISHKSEHASDAIRLANVLYDKFNIISFIDSQVWHHIDEVSNIINNKISKIREIGDTITYSHKSTSIVASNMFAMLSSSLFEVMDCSDGFIYIDSNKNKQIDEIDKGNVKSLKTQSPWLFLEMTYASKLRKKMHKRPSMRLAEDAMLKGRVGIESLSTRQKIEFDYSKEIIESVTISSIKNAISLPRNNSHPLYNLDNIYRVLDS